MHIKILAVYIGIYFLSFIHLEKIFYNPFGVLIVRYPSQHSHVRDFLHWYLLIEAEGRFGNLTIIGSGNGLSPRRCQAITWTNTGILLIVPWVVLKGATLDIHTLDLYEITTNLTVEKKNRINNS